MRETLIEPDLGFDHAPSGMAATLALRWGSHVGHYFGTGDELHDVLVPYFKAGLDNNERCLWVADAPFTAEQARAAMRRAMPDFEARERAGQIEIQDAAAFYDRAQPIRAEVVVAGLLQREQEALAAGYAGLRTNGNCAWVQRHHWPEFRRYEALVKGGIADRRLICMCSYDPSTLLASQMVDIADWHDIVLGRHGAGTQARVDAAAEIEAMPPMLMAVLGHDLLAPLAAVIAGSRLLAKRSLDARDRAIAEGIGASGRRMSALIDDVMDFAHGRLGIGMALKKTDEGLATAIQHAVDEMRLAHPDRVIEADLRIVRPVSADLNRMARVVSNLLGNALKYGDASAPVRIEATTDGEFALSVINRGPAIRAEIKDRLFAPFTRGDVRPDQQGLGLGLFIVSQIALSHGGRIEAVSDEQETRFTLRIPLPSPDAG